MHLNNPKSPAAQGQERPTRSQISHIYTTEISQKVLLRLPNRARPDLCSCNSSKALQICRYPHPFSAGQRPATTATRTSHRGDRGDVSIIRSLVRATVLPDKYFNANLH